MLASQIVVTLTWFVLLFAASIFAPSEAASEAQLICAQMGTAAADLTRAKLKSSGGPFAFGETSDITWSWSESAQKSTKCSGVTQTEKFHVKSSMFAAKYNNLNLHIEVVAHVSASSDRKLQVGGSGRLLELKLSGDALPTGQEVTIKGTMETVLKGKMNRVLNTIGL